MWNFFFVKRDRIVKLKRMIYKIKSLGSSLNIFVLLTGNVKLSCHQLFLQVCKINFKTTLVSKQQKFPYLCMINIIIGYTIDNFINSK